MKLIDSIVAEAAAMAELRRDVHAHPELSFQEHRTAALVVRKLQEWGIEVHRGLGGTGVVGVIRQGSSTRAIGLRADMDALPLQEG
ncbi:MAG: amidohydrolase, partial [Caldimonas manganoxidans]|nr:amidohydrolase [Caldimonas manganoxidans]